MEGLRRIFDNRDDIRATFVEDIQAGLTGTYRLPPGGRAGAHAAPWTALRAAGPAQLSGSTQQGPVAQGVAGPAQLSSFTQQGPFAQGAAGSAQLSSFSSFTQQGPVPQGAAGLAAGLPGHSGVSAAAAGQHTTGDAFVATPRTTTRTHQKLLKGRMRMRAHEGCAALPWINLGGVDQTQPCAGRRPPAGLI